MATKIIMPKQGLQMTEGTIARWLKREGDAVAPGEPLFEMETDKLTITIDAAAGGTLLKIVRPAGDTVPVAETIAYIGRPGEPVGAGEPPADARDKNAFATPRAKWRAEERGVDCAQISGSGPMGWIVERDVLAAASPKASPLARKLADLQGVPLSGVTGAGPRGKIMADDVRSGGTLPPRPDEAAPRDVAVPIDNMRGLIAKRMMESLHGMAQAAHRIEVDMDACARLRDELKALDVKVSYNDLVIRCTAQALRDHPEMNATMGDGQIVRKGAIHIGMAVATDAGLLVPVIASADRMSLGALAGCTRDLSRRAREGKIRPDELTGGTFTVTNLGADGPDHFTAIINAPEAGILAVGAVKTRPFVLPDGGLAARPTVWLTLTYDHRIVDGAPAAAFLKRIKTLLEHPALLL